MLTLHRIRQHLHTEPATAGGLGIGVCAGLGGKLSPMPVEPDHEVSLQAPWHTHDQPHHEL
jgi:hypothetical protein